jgi:hypothetical protein
MNYRTIIGGAFLAVTIAACSTAVAAPVPSSAPPPVRDQWYKEGHAPVDQPTWTGTNPNPPSNGYQNCRRQCP